MWNTRGTRIQVSSGWSCSGKDPGLARGNLFAIDHFKDLANTVFLTCPFALIVFPVSLPGLRQVDRLSVFLASASAGMSVFFFVVNPEIGFFRDWDLMSLPAIPFTALVVVGLLRLRDRPRWTNYWLSFVLILVIASTFSWVHLNSEPALAEQRFSHLIRTTTLSTHARAYGFESLGTYQRTTKNDLSAAARSYVMAVSADPQNPRLFDLAGVAEFKLGRHSSALMYLEKAVEMSHRRDVRYLDNLAALYAAADEHDSTLVIFRRALEIEPQSAARFRNLGLALVNAGKFQAAVDTLQIALELYPDDSVSATALEVARAASLGQFDKK